MALYDFSQTTTTTTKADYSAGSLSPDSPTNKELNFWDYPYFTEWFASYIKHAKVKKAIDGFADWVLGQGYVTDDPIAKADLDHISGNGKEGFADVLWNAIVMKKINGDAFVHVMRDPKDKEFGRIINMRVLDCNRMTTHFNGKGRVKEYRYYSSAERTGDDFVTYQPNEILHMMNDKVGDEMHGRSVIEAITWNIEAQEEAKRVLRKLVWRSGVVRVIEVDTANSAELATLKAQYKTAEENGDVLLLPKDKAKAIDWKPSLDYAGIIAWLNYLDDEFYISIGFPRDLAGASTQATEASMKMAYVTHEPLYLKEVKELEDALWNQLGLKIVFNKQQSITSGVQDDEAKNTGQTQVRT